MSEFSGVDSLSAGDILLYRTTSLMGRAIRLLDGAEVSHAGLVLGDGVAEALVREGLVQRPVAESIGNDSKWVAVMRMQPVPGPMTPVLDVAQNYLDQGNRYGYEQILLLAGICLTRKLDIDNRLLRRLVRADMCQAVDLISCLHGEGKEPMICSEFVFRTYDEALPAKDDPYSLKILSQGSREPRRRFSRVRRLCGRFGGTAEPPLPNVHPESLLGRLEASGETVDSLPAPDTLKSALPPVDEDLDALIEQYVTEAEGMKAAVPLATAAEPDVTDDELLDTARMFAGELAGAAAGKAEVEKRLYGTPPASAEQAAPTLAEILADFVTPGDLMKSPSLERVGTIEP